MEKIKKELKIIEEYIIKNNEFKDKSIYYTLEIIENVLEWSKKLWVLNSPFVSSKPNFFMKLINWFV